jgi:fatty acid desaturase
MPNSLGKWSGVAPWIALTIAASRLPWWVVAPLGGFLVAWHGSFQHETIHGHPTRWRAVNNALGSFSLGLWIPYGIYRDLHLAHHRTGQLTDPLEDSESFYVTGDAWTRAGALRRLVLRANTTLLGRLVLGPWLTVLGFFRTELGRLVAGDRRHLRAWAWHLVVVAVVAAWLELVCRLPLVHYLLLFVYPGVALTLLRSFAEHRPAATNAERVGIVEAGPLTGLLFLNNNLHVVHHDEPALAWYELPARYRALRASILAKNGGFFFSSYASLIARFALRSKDAPVHPRWAR